MRSRLKIAVAEDERDTRAFLHECLSQLGHDVRAAPDGQQLVALCREFRPDLIVTDYAMPRLDGLSAAAEVNLEHSLPVILLSARDDIEQLAAASSVRVASFLQKPVKYAELKAAVALVIAGF